MGIGVRQAIEKEIKERRTAELEVEHLTRDLVAALEHEKSDRERDDITLRNQIANLRQELSGEKEDRSGDIALCKRSLITLEGNQMQHFKELRHYVDSEASERVALNERLDLVCSDIRATMEADRAAQGVTTKDLERAIIKNRQANDAEIRDRVMCFEEHTHNLNEMRQMLSSARVELGAEKEERIEDVSAMRLAIQNFDQKVVMQFRDFKIGLDNESGERINSNEKLEKRLAELRGAVLVAVRGPGMR